MGSDSSKLQQRELAEEQERKRIERERQDAVRILEQQQYAEWQKAKLIEKHHREMRAQEEAKRKQANEERQRQESLRQAQLQQQFQDEQVRAQQLQLQQQRSQQQQLQQLQHQRLQQQSAATAETGSFVLPPHMYVPVAKLQKQKINAAETVSPVLPLSSKVPVAELQKQNISAAKTGSSKLPTHINEPAAKLQKQKIYAVGTALSVSPVRSRDPMIKLQKQKISTAMTSLLIAKCDSSHNAYQARLAAANVSCVEWTDIDYLQETHGMSKYVAENIITLFKSKNAISFIARYRKNMTLNMDLDELKNVRDSLKSASRIKQKASDLTKEIDKQGKWTPELHVFIHAMKSLKEINWMECMFTRSRSNFTRRTSDILSCLVKVAEDMMKGIEPANLSSLVHPEIELLEPARDMRTDIISILADIISEEKCISEIIQVLRRKHSLIIQVIKTKDNEKEEKKPKTVKQKSNETKYNFYYNFSSFEDKLKPHQILEINRGQEQNILKVDIKVPDEFGEDFKQYCAMHYKKICNASMLHKILLPSAFNHTWSKVIRPAICTQARKELTEKGEIAVIDEIAKNIKQLLLAPPIESKVVIGIEPGLDGSCKLAVVTDKGDVLETGTIHPHDINNPKAKHEAQRTLAGIILLRKCTILALRNGKGYRETKDFLDELIKNRAFEPMNVVYTTVDKIACSAPSGKTSSDVSDLHANFESAISVARRLLDPMGELVKIDPKKLNPKVYHFNLPEKQLTAKLNEAIEEAVCSVGVDVNTASVSLLKRVAGLDETKAKKIVEWRKRSGPFVTRNDLKKVPGICSRTFEQCAGFIRIIPETAIALNDRISEDSFIYLDQTSIHPESYEIAEAFLKAANCDLQQLGTKTFVFAVTLFANQGYNELAKKFNTSVETMKIIVESLSVEKGRDVGGKSDTTDNPTTSTTFQNVKVGAILTGVVRGIAPFGAFLDVGFEVQGLLHNNNMKGITLNRGQKVEVRVDKVNRERRRLGLALIKCL